MKKFKALFVISLVVLTFATSFAVVEASQFQPIVPLPGITSEQGITLTFAQYVNQIFKLVISLSAILAVLVIIYGGFEYMTSSAGISKKNGMERIQGAVTGLFLLLSVTLILQIINPCILEITVLSGTTSEQCSRQVAATQQGAQVTGQGTGQGQGAGQGTVGGPQTGATRPCTSLRATSCADGTQAVRRCAAGLTLSDPPATGGCPNSGGIVFACLNSACGSPPNTSVVRDGTWRVVAQGATCNLAGAPATEAPIQPLAYCCSVESPSWEQFLSGCERKLSATCATAQPRTVLICGGQR